MCNILPTPPFCTEFYSSVQIIISCLEQVLYEACRMLSHLYYYIQREKQGQEGFKALDVAKKYIIGTFRKYPLLLIKIYRGRQPP
jgi:hypothetical protein